MPRHICIDCQRKCDIWFAPLWSLSGEKVLFNPDESRIPVSNTLILNLFTKPGTSFILPATPCSAFPFATVKGTLFRDVALLDWLSTNNFNYIRHLLIIIQCFWNCGFTRLIITPSSPQLKFANCLTCLHGRADRISPTRVTTPTFTFRDIVIGHSETHS